MPTLRKSLLAGLALFFLSQFTLYSQREMVFRENQIWGHLRVAITDLATGREVPARCYLVSSTGENWVPSGALTYVKPPERNFIAPGRFQLELPAGKYTLRIERGMEYLPESRTIDIESGSIQDLRVGLRRWVHMNARGWYSGDLHNHRGSEEMPQILLSEDLNLAPSVASWIWDDRSISVEPPRGRGESMIRSADSDHVYSIFDTEIERRGPGAIVLLGLKSPLDFKGYNLSPPTTVFTEAAHRQGGYVDAEKLMWRDIAALIALGQVDFAGLAANSYTPYGVEIDSGNTPAEMPLRGMALYYRFLNCGFKLPVSAGTASGVKPAPLGYNRVYVHLEREFSYEEFFSALKAGRSFATNGPMLFLTVDGQEPGATVQIAGGQRKKLTIRAQATSANDLERLEIIWKGKVLKSVTQVERTQSLTAEVEFEASETGWIAARAFEAPTVTMRFAQTSPVYVKAGIDRGTVQEDAQFFVDWMDRQIRFYSAIPVGRPAEGSAGVPGAGGLSFQAEAHREAMLDMFRRARRVYAEMASR